MMALRGFAGAILAIGLASWLAAIAAAAVSAMNVFGTLGDLPVHTDGYGAFEPSEQSRLIAGRIMNGVFLSVDRMAFAGAAVAAIGFVLLLITRIGWARPAILFTAICLAVGVSCCVMYATLTPDLQALLAERFDAARAGDVERASEIVSQFDPLHERANRLFQVQLIAVACAIASFGASNTQYKKQVNNGSGT